MDLPAGFDYVSEASAKTLCVQIHYTHLDITLLQVLTYCVLQCKASTGTFSSINSIKGEYIILINNELLFMPLYLQISDCAFSKFTILKKQKLAEYS